MEVCEAVLPVSKEANLGLSAEVADPPFDATEGRPGVSPGLGVEVREITPERLLPSPERDRERGRASKARFSPSSLTVGVGRGELLRELTLFEREGRARPVLMATIAAIGE